MTKCVAGLPYHDWDWVQNAESEICMQCYLCGEYFIVGPLSWIPMFAPASRMLSKNS